jgi:hypothetical protein
MYIKLVILFTYKLPSSMLIIVNIVNLPQTTIMTVCVRQHWFCKRQNAYRLILMQTVRHRCSAGGIAYACLTTGYSFDEPRASNSCLLTQYNSFGGWFDLSANLTNSPVIFIFSEIF